MAYLRQNVWDLDGEWADPVLWYARGVAAMRGRPLAQPTSWRFYAAIHGFDQRLWQQLGYLHPADQPPADDLVKRFWAQCQHGSWYFLPWHRGYVLAFEANVRAAVVQLGGPADWALPYWNYFKPNEAALPSAFASPDWPDGTGDNPLYLPARYGPDGDGKVYVPLDQVNLQAMAMNEFTGTAGGGSPGFGGVDTGFSHGGHVHGGIETQPHDWVHGLVGGADPTDPNLPGAMSDPDSAGLDPIFWLHHANIDRLWESWHDTGRLDPAEPRWRDGPASIGQRAFMMPMPDGSTWTYTPSQMTDLAALGYAYDDLSPAGTPVQRLAAAAPELAAATPELAAAMAPEGARAVPEDTDVELVGATTEPVPVHGRDVRSRVRLDTGMRRKVAARLAPTAAEPDRLFLNLENVRGRSDAAAFQVFVGVPDDEDPAAHPERLAGSVAPFGLRKASLADEEHAGQGLTFVLEITEIVDRLHLEDDIEHLPVRIVPVRPVAQETEISIGRISIFRQGR